MSAPVSTCREWRDQSERSSRFGWTLGDQVGAPAAAVGENVVVEGFLQGHGREQQEAAQAHAQGIPIGPHAVLDGLAALHVGGLRDLRAGAWRRTAGGGRRRRIACEASSLRSRLPVGAGVGRKGQAERQPGPVVRIGVRRGHFDRCLRRGRPRPQHTGRSQRGTGAGSRGRQCRALLPTGFPPPTFGGRV